MGEMADMALEYASITEDQAYDYLAGYSSAEDAYEQGLIDEQGYAVQDMGHIADQHWRDLTDTDNQLRHAEKDFELATRRTPAAKRKALNEAAIANLSKPNPTCNWCGEQMKPRHGKFGKFYFCTCPEQCTVSDKYWQSIKVNN